MGVGVDGDVFVAREEGESVRTLKVGENLVLRNCPEAGCVAGCMISWHFVDLRKSVSWTTLWPGAQPCPQLDGYCSVCVFVPAFACMV
eukprot:1160760-Pelagomonas_calceolata.AAC.3